MKEKTVELCILLFCVFLLGVVIFGFGGCENSLPVPAGEATDSVSVDIPASEEFDTIKYTEGTEVENPALLTISGNEETSYLTITCKDRRWYEIREELHGQEAEFVLNALRKSVQYGYSLPEDFDACEGIPESMERFLVRSE